MEPFATVCNSTGLHRCSPWDHSAGPTPSHQDTAGPLQVLPAGPPNRGLHARYGQSLSCVCFIFFFLFSVHARFIWKDDCQLKLFKNSGRGCAILWVLVFIPNQEGATPHSTCLIRRLGCGLCLDFIVCKHTHTHINKHTYIHTYTYVKCIRCKRYIFIY